MLRKLVRTASKVQAGRAYVVEMLTSVLASALNIADKLVFSINFSYRLGALVISHEVRRP